VETEQHGWQVGRKESVHEVGERVVVMRGEGKRRIKLVVPVVVVLGEEILRVQDIAM